MHINDTMTVSAPKKFRRSYVVKTMTAFNRF